MSSSVRQQTPIAVVGVSALFPGSTDAQGFWRDILAGKDLITEVPPSHWLIDDYYSDNARAADKTYAKRGGFLSPVDFDPLEFGIPPTIAPATDSAQLLALIVAQQVLEDASSGQFASMNRERISVLLGVTSAQELYGTMVSRLQRPVWLKALRESGIPEVEAQAICERIANHYVPWQESTFPGLLGNVVAGRIANRFDLRGTNAVTDAACASSLAALSMGLNELELGKSDLVITGGVDAMNDILMYMCFSKTPALSPSGDCRPFSAAADGTLLGEGLAMVALKRLADAERDGDRVYAVIRGLGSSSDGRANSVYAPLPEGQARALRRAYEVAGYGPETVELVEAHGTGTKAGDAAEFAGLKLAFAESKSVGPWCALGSVKSQIGHTKAAAGAAGLFKAVMALHHKVLPPTIKVDAPNPKLEIEQSPFYLNTKARPWIRDASHPRRASVSSFGFGGSNFHLTLEEYVPQPGGHGKAAWQLPTAPTELFVWSAPHPQALLEKCRVALQGAAPFRAVARVSQLQFVAAEKCRLAVVARDLSELQSMLSQAFARIEQAPEQAFAIPQGAAYRAESAQGEVAFLFPGQGSQYVGMGADVAMAFEVARHTWDEAAEQVFAGERLHQVVFPHPVFSEAASAAQQQKLTQTQWAQPALAVHSVALSRLLHALGVRPACVAGHSFGEASALWQAGVFDAATLLKIARRRGELMREAAATAAGAMSAVVASRDTAQAVLRESGAQVVVANHNAPEQVVLSGREDELAVVEKLLQARGIFSKRLAVATAFHSPIVARSAAPFHDFLASVALQVPRLDVYGNATAAPYAPDAAAVRAQLAQQLARPVRFVEQIEAMYARGVRTFVEVGPGNVLTDLVGRILGERAHDAIAVDRKGKHGVTAFQEGLAQLAVAGVSLNLAPLWAPFAPPAETPRKKAAMSMPVSGSNVGKLYPPAGGSAALPPPNPPRAPAPPGAMASPVVSNSSELLRAFQETQRQTAEAHAAHQKAMADSHLAFLKAAEASLSALGALSGHSAAALPQVVAAPVAPAAPVMKPEVTPLAIPVMPSPPPPAPAADVAGVLLSVVAEKTGYPQEMLGLSMELEADLGIDSIKRVEILSALRERVPQLPEVKPTDLAVLRTLGQIVSHLAGAKGVTAAPAPAVPPAPALAAAADVAGVLLSVVAEKTGYPKEMLGLAMELEADLGIDSIKRVEILSALRERVPQLPEVKPTDLAVLRTLGQIVTHLGATNGVTAAPAPISPPAPAAAADVAGVLLSVVAEKTGYPKEMLGLAMELEADLGIDSIKRVEILSALRERVPQLPEVKPTDLATLRTLGQIVAHLEGKPAAVEKSEPVSAAVASSVRRWAVREVESSAVGLALPGILSAQHLCVTDDGGGVAPALVERLRREGVVAAIVHADSIPEVADALIFLGGLRKVSSVEEALAVNREAFHAARAVAARFEAKGGAWVTVQGTGGDFGLSGKSELRAFLGGLRALARTAAQEWPKATVKAIDVERGARDAQAVADAIAQELLQGGITAEVGLHADGRRTTLASVLAPAASLSTEHLGQESVLVVSGGGRGVTSAALVALAQAKQPKIVLLGRTVLGDEPQEFAALHDESALKRAVMMRAQARGETLSPLEVSRAAAAIFAAREIRSTLEQLLRAGSQVKYVALDVTDASALSSALEPVRREWGPITGLIHGAGVLADKRLAEKTDAQFDLVFDTKVRGLLSLLTATENDPLTTLCLFSSVAARTGNVGQADYAMANEVLNLVACAERARRGASCLVRAIGWGPWEGGMVTPALKAHFEKQGVPLVPLAEGARRFVEELQSGGDDVNVVIAGAMGEGALGLKKTPTATLELKVSRKSHPQLEDHRIGGLPVVPMVLAVEWFLRAAQACRPDLVCLKVMHLKVLRGIKLEHFADDGDVLAVTAQQRSNGAGAEITVELRSLSGTVYYSGTVQLGERPVPSPQAAAAPQLSGWAEPQIYDGHLLFHGPHFQVIDSIHGVSREGIAGTLKGTGAAWPQQQWHSDAAVMDGGLQLAVLWARHVIGGATLPMGLSEYRSYRGGLLEGPIEGVVRARAVFAERTVCDIAFCDAEGQVLAELIGVETVLRP